MPTPKTPTPTQGCASQTCRHHVGKGSILHPTALPCLWASLWALVTLAEQMWRSPGQGEEQSELQGKGDLLAQERGSLMGLRVASAEGGSDSPWGCSQRDMGPVHSARPSDIRAASATGSALQGRIPDLWRPGDHHPSLQGPQRATERAHSL